MQGARILCDKGGFSAASRSFVDAVGQNLGEMLDAVVL